MKACTGLGSWTRPRQPRPVLSAENRAHPRQWRASGRSRADTTTVPLVSFPDPPQLARAPESCDLAIVGGGIIGLAVARELIRRNPRESVCVLEREAELGTHQTGHSSGVIHAGVYYEPGSLKARLCVEGARELYAYCAERGIANEECGKVILATDSSELAGLDELERRGKANGVPGLRRIDAAGIEQIEPHARGIAGLHSPSTGVVDFPAVARSYARDVLEAGGAIARRCEVTDVDIKTRSLLLVHAGGTTPRPAMRSSAPAPGPIGWPWRRARTPIRGSCPSAGPTCGSCLSAGIWCAR